MLFSGKKNLQETFIYFFFSSQTAIKYTDLKKIILNDKIFEIIIRIHILFLNPVYNFLAKIFIFSGKRAADRYQKLHAYSQFKQPI